jgi:hypothetical protein
MLPHLLLAILCAFAVAPAANAAAASPVSQAAEPLQFYVFSFTDTPVDEAAQDVVVGALAYDLEIDQAVDAVVTFRADGWYSSDALLKDFGTALLDQDIALVRTGAGSYALVPRTNAPMLMARGGVVMQLTQPQSAREPVGLVADDEPRTVYAASPAPWWDGAAAALALFFAGAAAGAAALFGGQVVWRRAEAERRRLSPPLLRLTDQRETRQPPVEAARPDPELVIPRFENRT